MLWSRYQGLSQQTNKLNCRGLQFHESQQTIAGETGYWMNGRDKCFFISPNNTIPGKTSGLMNEGDTCLEVKTAGNAKLVSPAQPKRGCSARKDDLCGIRPAAEGEDGECIAAMIVNRRLYRNVQTK